MVKFLNEGHLCKHTWYPYSLKGYYVEMSMIQVDNYNVVFQPLPEINIVQSLIKSLGSPTVTTTHSPNFSFSSMYAK